MNDDDDDDYITIYSCLSLYNPHYITITTYVRIADFLDWITSSLLMMTIAYTNSWADFEAEFVSETTDCGDHELLLFFKGLFFFKCDA